MARSETYTDEEISDFVDWLQDMQIIESYLGRRSLREWSRTPAT